MFSKFKILILILALTYLVIPHQAHAFIGTGIFDFFDSALGGIEEIAGPFAGKIIAFLFTYFIGFILLLLSGSLLKGAMDPSWLAIEGDSLVQTGWQFTVGISNMFLIIILIVIAFGFILKLENLQMKKTLPRLLLVALLMNFSLVFVQFFIDISNIFYNTFFLGNEDLPNKIMENLAQGTLHSIGLIIGWISTLSLSFIVPIIAPFVQLAMVTMMITVVPSQMVIMVLQTVILYVLSSIFLMYTILFAARVFIVKLLAILAPLAFLSMILPQTKKYWDQWLHTLLEWVLLGIPFIFFMVLGLKSAETFLPAADYGVQYTAEGADNALFGFKLEPYVAYYLFLSLYFVIVAFISKKTMPAAAQGIIDGALNLGKMAMGRGIIPLGKAAGDRLNRLSISQKEKEEDISKRRAAGEKIKLSTMQSIGMGLGHWTKRGVDLGHKITGTSAAASVKKSLNAKVSDYENRYGDDYKTAIASFKGIAGKEVGSNFNRAALIFYLEKTKGGKALSKLSATQLSRGIQSIANLSPDKMTDILRHMPELADGDTAEIKFKDNGKTAGAIRRAIIPDNLLKDPITLKYKDDDIQALYEEGIKEKDLLRIATMKKTVASMKTADIDGLGDILGDNKTFQETVAKYKNDRPFLQRAFEKFGPKFINSVQGIARGDLTSTARTNPSLLMMQGTQFGQAFMENWTSSINSKEKIKQFIQKTGTSPLAWSSLPNLPNISPSPTEQDKNRFADYAEGKRTPPDKTNLGALRDVSGAINALAYRVKEANDGIKRLEAEKTDPNNASKQIILDRQIHEKQLKQTEYEQRKRDFEDLSILIKRKKPTK